MPSGELRDLWFLFCDFGHPLFPLNFAWCSSYSYLPLDLLNPFAFLPVSSGVRLAHTYIVDN